MKITSVTTHYERKINLGDYNSVTLAAWNTVEVEETDEVEAAMAYSMSLCRDQVREAALPFVKRTGVAVTDSLAGMQVNGGGR